MLFLIMYLIFYIVFSSGLRLMNREKHTSTKVIDEILVITLNSPNSKVNYFCFTKKNYHLT